LKRIFSLLMVLMLLFGHALAEETPLTQKEYFAAQESASYMVDVPGKGFMRYYAQNDPMYATVKYENRRQNNRRKFATGGCVPTSLAMALANLVPMERLIELDQESYKGRGYTFCVCSCGPYHCNGKHEQYKLTTAEEFYRYLPMVTGAYACGNGPKAIIYRRNHGGTSTSIFKIFSDIFGLGFKSKLTHEEALAAIDEGGICIVSTGGRKTPFAKGGHYMILASYDEEYLYILDPVIKESYKETDKDGYLEILSPGLVKARRSDLKKLCLTTYTVLFPTAAE